MCVYMKLHLSLSILTNRVFQVSVREFQIIWLTKKKKKKKQTNKQTLESLHIKPSTNKPNHRGASASAVTHHVG